jgi:hypothetical protein
MIYISSIKMGCILEPASNRTATDQRYMTKKITVIDVEEII